MDSELLGNILIYGAGSVGIALGASLYSKSKAITFLARGETLQAIRDDGIKRTGMFGELEAKTGEVRAVSSMEELADHSIDLVLVCTKTLTNEEAADTLSSHRDKLAENAKIVIFQNGWGNDRPFLACFPEEMIYRARVITGFARTAPNISNITVHTAPILIGSLYGADTACVEPLAQAIADSGIPCEITNTLEEAIWAKMLYNTTLNALGAVLRVPYGTLAESASSRQIMDRLIDETFLVMEINGFHTFWETPDEYRDEFYGKLIPDTYDHRSSTLQDIEKKQKTEIDSLNGCIVRMAGECGQEAPTHQILCELIAALEDNF